MFNIGFDCNVADTTQNIKKNKFIFGPFAYYISIFVNLIRKKATRLKIELDGETVHNGEMLLTSLANGCYCGGGIKSNPLASVQDGFININIIKNISVFRFLSLLPYYMKGTFLSLKDIDKIILSKKCKKVCVTPYEKKFKFCNDGEIESASKTEFEIVHHAFNFVIPKVAQKVLK
jgi:diacylglycerol kinase family enzyme